MSASVLEAFIAASHEVTVALIVAVSAELSALASEADRVMLVLREMVCISSFIVFSRYCAELKGGCSGVTRPAGLSSDIIIRTHKDRPMNKQEPLLRSNH